MRRSTFALVAALVMAVAAAAAATPVARAAGTLCVGGKPGCFATIQDAVNAAHDGDTINISPGTFAGGVTIDVSVNLIGAGSNRTIINGGGPVLTIGQNSDTTEPTVSIRGVTVTGGVTQSSFLGDWFAEGGGIEIPPSCTTGPGCPSFEYGPGATVTIADSMITGNRVTPQSTVTFCGPIPCSFSQGGGIDSAGALTLINTRVSDNVSGGAGSVTLGASAGGIESQSLGTLALKHCYVTDNQGAVSAPDGVFSQGGGIDSNGAATIEDSVVSGNSVTTSNISGEVDAFAGGIRVNGPFLLARSSVDHNHVQTSVSSSGDAFLFTASGGVGFDGGAGVITDTRITANTLDATTPAGTAVALGGGLGSGTLDGVTVRNSLIAQNTVSARTATGTAFGEGGGVSNFALMTLEQTIVTDNTVTATGPAGGARGGGIGNDIFPGLPPPTLTLTDSKVTANNLIADPGLTVQGGGLYTTSPVTLTRTVIAGNKPDQCFGC